MTSGSKKRSVLIGTGMVLRNLSHSPAPPCGATLFVRMALLPAIGL